VIHMSAFAEERSDKYEKRVGPMLKVQINLKKYGKSWKQHMVSSKTYYNVRPYERMGSMLITRYLNIVKACCL